MSGRDGKTWRGMKGLRRGHWGGGDTRKGHMGVGDSWGGHSLGFGDHQRGPGLPGAGYGAEPSW